jgi:KUP system potassium uptake protein
LFFFFFVVFFQERFAMAQTETSIRQALIEALPLPPVAPSRLSPPIPRQSFSMKNFSKSLVLLWGSLSCLGVVFGDLGTSPIYAFRSAFSRGSLTMTDSNVYGVLSMIVYSLLLVVTCKYLFILCFVESSNGSGGTLALVGRLNDQFPAEDAVRRFLLVPCSMVAISLFLADSIITPGVSVLSAVEGPVFFCRTKLSLVNYFVGLESLWPRMEPYSPVIAIVVLSVLFYCQRFGTGKVGFPLFFFEFELVYMKTQLGGVFGPIMLCYFLAIGTLGLTTIVLLGNVSFGCVFFCAGSETFLFSGNYGVFRAMNPFYSLYFMWSDPNGAWIALQSVILAVTGAEALYTDMGAGALLVLSSVSLIFTGHFGRAPIQLSWHAVVLPCLVFSYLGQGAVVKYL